MLAGMRLWPARVTAWRVAVISGVRSGNLETSKAALWASVFQPGAVKTLTEPVLPVDDTVSAWCVDVAAC